MLTRDEITQALVDSGRFTNASASNFRPTTYHVTLGKEAYISGSRHKTFLSPFDALVLSPGKFALIVTRERFEMPPNATALIGAESRLMRSGILLLHGLAVHPGFTGHLVFGLVTLSQNEFLLPYGCPVANLVFDNHAPVPPGQLYTDNDPQLALGEIPDSYIDQLSNMRVVSRSLYDLDRYVNSLAIPQRVSMWLMIIGAVVGLLAVFIAVFYPLFFLQTNLSFLQEQVSALDQRLSRLGAP